MRMRIWTGTCDEFGSHQTRMQRPERVGQQLQY